MSENVWLGMSTDVKLYRQIQKLRLGIGERIRSVEQGRSERNVARDREWFDGLYAIEKNVRKSVETLAQTHPLWTDWLQYVRGIGPLNMAQLIGEIVGINEHHNAIARKEPKARDERERAWAKERGTEIKPTGIGAFDTVSALWKYAGLAPGQKPIKGEVLSYNNRLKTVCLGIVGDCMIRANSPYRVIYDNAKAKYEETRPDWTKGHRHYAARRKMVKVFLSHFWEHWRELEGYPTRKAYVLEHLGHTHEHEWQDFVEPEYFDGFVTMIEKEIEMARGTE